jgi:hypothetical protein
MSALAGTILMALLATIGHATAFLPTGTLVAAPPLATPLPAAYDCATGAPLEPGRAVLSIDPARFPVGAYVRPLDPRWLMSPGRIVSHSHWTKAPTHYLAATDHRRPALQSTSCSRDMEVDVYARDGYVVLRHTPEGRGIFFRTNLEVPGGELTIGIIEGDVDGTYLGSKAYLSWFGSATTLVSARIPGYRRVHTDGDLFTFGVEGFDVYVKFNHTEFLRFKEYRHMQPGRMSLKANAGYGTRRTVLRHLTPKALLSKYERGVLDLRDFGLSSRRATGTIRAGSAQFVIDTPPSTPFAVGDSVIVEIGGEAGRGQRGSVGVGGTWPRKRYPTSAVMLADLSNVEGTFAWVETDGSVWRWEGQLWHEFSTSQPNRRYRHYYLARAIPLALQATISHISGNGTILTLDKAAHADSTGATLYLDNAPVLNRVLRDPRYDGEANWPRVLAPSDFTAITPADLQLNIPAGEYAIGNALSLRSHPGWKVVGAGSGRTKIFSPRGTRSATLHVSSSPGVRISDLHLQGNARDHGYGLAVTETDAPQGTTYPSGIVFGPGSDNGIASDLVVSDVFQVAVGTSYAAEVWARRVQSVMTDGLRDYVQWMFQWADSRGGGCVECSVESPTILGGFETFKSVGTTFRDCSGVNAVAAANGAGGFLFENLTLRIRAGANNGNTWFSVHNPMVNINTNIGLKNVDLGGTLRNVTMIQEGYVDTLGGKHDTLKGIVVNNRNPNITILGGRYEAPDYRAPSVMHGGMGIDSTGANLVVDGFRVEGRTDGSWGNINVTSGVIRNCTATTIRVKPGVTVSNCQAIQMPW